MFSVVTPADTKALTTLATIKTDLGITGSLEDAYLTEKINQASAAVCAYLKVPVASDGSVTLASEDLLQTFRFEGRNDRLMFTGVGAVNPRRKLILARKPVTAIASVVINDTTLDPSEYEIDGAPALLSRLRNDRAIPWGDCRKIVVAYTAGYLLQDEGDDRTLPYDVEQAVIDLVKSARSARTRDPNLREIEITDISRKVYWVGGTPSDTTLPPGIADILDQSPARYGSLAR